MADQFPSLPDNVPPDLVVDFDVYDPPGASRDIFAAWHKLHDGPPFVWTPHYGGHWIATRAEDIEFMQRNHDPFSMRDVSLPPGMKAQRLLPLEADPPEHTGFRMLINRWFSPASVNSLMESMRTTAKDLIEGFYQKGECEFIADFSLRLPITIFAQMARLPPEDSPQLLAWTEQNIRGGSLEDKATGFAGMTGYVMRLIEERRAHPGDDIISAVVHGKIGGEPLNLPDTVSMCLTILFGGLDTVASTLGFIAHFLAVSPAHRHQLHKRPDLLPNAIDEFLRRFPVANTTRVVTRPYDYKGIRFKAGDRVQCNPVMHSLDSEKYADPTRVDFTRERVSAQAGFGSGPHHCPGAILARAEIRIFLEEWLARIPEFAIKPGRSASFLPGQIQAVLSLPLAWPVAAGIIVGGHGKEE